MIGGRVVAFVHAKGSSERVPSKNLRSLGGRPLFLYAIDNALQARLVEQVVIDSDSEQILELGEKAGAQVLRRPAELATNRASGDDLAYWQASQARHAEIVLQVIPTAPFLQPSTIDSAVELLDEEPLLDSVVGTHSDVFYEWRNGAPSYYKADGTIPNSFELEPKVYETTGLYVNRTAFVLRERKRLNPANCRALPLSRIEAVDINTEEDFVFAELISTGLRDRAAKSRRSA